MRRIGWIGLGKMGAPMAQNLLDAGHRLFVYNRTASKADDLVGGGATAATQPADVAKEAEVVFSMLADDAALQQMLLGDSGAIAAMNSGSVLVEMSTVSPAVSAKIDAACTKQDVGYVRAPVSGSVAFAKSAHLTFLTSGPAAAHSDILPLLETLGARQFHVGQACEARVLKLVINTMIGNTAAMIGEAMALGLKNGLDREKMLDVIDGSVAASPLIGYKLAALKAQDYTPAFEASMISKDFDLALDMARRSNTPIPMTAQVREGWSALIARGDGDADFFKYVELALDQAGFNDT